MREADFAAVRYYNKTGAAPVVLICEHASCAIPACFDGLGLEPEARRAHIAWDIGARDVARGIADALDAPLIEGAVSRLVYDCNRPLEAPDAIPARSEIFDVPGNAGLSAADRAARHRSVHDPFHSAVSEVVDAKLAAGLRPSIVTVHSFTPVYHGTRRDLDLGFLHHGDAGALARAALKAEAAAGRYIARLNEPYATSDGVTYSLHRHGVARGLPALMVEIRNDLIDRPEAAKAMAAHLARTLAAALARLGADSEVSPRARADSEALSRTSAGSEAMPRASAGGEPAR